MAIMTGFESKLVRLNWIKNEMWTLYEEMPGIRGKNPTNSLIMWEIIGGFMTIRLSEFIEVREKILEDLRLMKKEKVDDCLIAFWQPTLLCLRSSTADRPFGASNPHRTSGIIRDFGKKSVIILRA